MSKEGIPAVYEVKGNDHIRHINKTQQDKLPVSERPRVKEWHQRIRATTSSTTTSSVTHRRRSNT